MERLLANCDLKVSFRLLERFRNRRGSFVYKQRVAAREKPIERVGRVIARLAAIPTSSSSPWSTTIGTMATATPDLRRVACTEAAKAAAKQAPQVLQQAR